ncbi:hypothetical protein [Nostoc sp. CALU 546]|uniref:hypothetical protein n=1 Tax=Nostoc sp. CALU 546 TaxID=1867241 RepID=UPI003B67D4FE
MKCECYADVTGCDRGKFLTKSLETNACKRYGIFKAGIRACWAEAVRQLQNLLISDFSVKGCTSLKKLLREYPGKMGRNWVVLRYFYPSD